MGVGEDFLVRLLALQDFGFAAHALGKAQHMLDGVLPLAAQTVMALVFDIDGRPGGFEAAGHALGNAHKSSRGFA